MAQADQTVQNATFPTVRADINNNLAALFSANSGATAPSVTVAFQDWIDTSGADAVWKKRNAANNAWLTVATFLGSGLSLGGFAPGTVMLFVQTAAPTGWTKSTTHDNKALRVVSGSVTTGGTQNFTAVLNGNVGATTLTTAQMPSHTHTPGADQLKWYNKIGNYNGLCPFAYRKHNCHRRRRLTHTQHGRCLC
jgi:hypothetical protein